MGHILVILTLLLGREQKKCKLEKFVTYLYYIIIVCARAHMRACICICVHIHVCVVCNTHVVACIHVRV